MNPRWDPDFVDRCLWDLVTHAGEWRRLGRLYASDLPSFERCCAVRDAVEWGRKLGFAIEGDRAGWSSRGYRVTGFRHPQMVYLTKTGRPAHEREEAQITGQLSIAAEV